MKQQNKIALCAIGRMENKYAREFVEHYLSIGFDHIYLYDNGNEYEEKLVTVLEDFVKDKKITITDFPRNDADRQKDAYNQCYHTYGHLYSWMAFFDFDEYLTIVSGEEIHSFMDRYKDSQCLLINWMNMTDNGLVLNDGRKLQERFTEPMSFDKSLNGEFPENNHVKSIVRTGISGLAFQKNPHVPTFPKIDCCTTDGQHCKRCARQPYNHSIAYLKHFTTKTISEYLETKARRGVPDRTWEEFVKDYADFFFKINDVFCPADIYIYNFLIVSRIRRHDAGNMKNYGIHGSRASISVMVSLM